MQIPPASGLPASAAGAPLSQQAGPAAERAASDSAAGQRTADSDMKADKAAGIGQTEHDQQASDRDADGRRLWEQRNETNEHPDEKPEEQPTQDPTGNRGTTLDLTG